MTNRFTTFLVLIVNTGILTFYFTQRNNGLEQIILGDDLVYTASQDKSSAVLFYGLITIVANTLLYYFEKLFRDKFLSNTTKKRIKPYYVLLKFGVTPFIFLVEYIRLTVF